MILLLALLVQVADSTRPCVVVFDSTGTTTIRDFGNGIANYHVSGGFVAHCQDQPETNLRSDSAAYYGVTDQLVLIGSARMEDPSMVLTASRIRYYTRSEQLEALGKVDATNRGTQTRIRGPRLDYFRAAPGVRDTAEMYAPARPTIEYYPTSQSGDTGTVEPYIVVGDRVRMKGDEQIWAGGNVTIDRSDLAARGDSIWIDFAAGQGEILHTPSIEAKGDNSVHLTGDLLSLELEDRELKQLIATGNGRAKGEDFVLTADTMVLLLAERELTGVIAWGDSLRPYIDSETSTIQADSLAIDTPEQLLREVRAFGAALATSIPDDSTRRPEPDWLAGDTVFASFQTAPDSAGIDETRLEQLVAHGSARALYFVPNKDDPTSPPAISYARGERITVSIGEDGVRQVHVDGNADGVYLEPVTSTPDTTRTR